MANLSIFFLKIIFFATCEMANGKHKLRKSNSKYGLFNLNKGLNWLKGLLTLDQTKIYGEGFQVYHIFTNSLASNRLLFRKYYKWNLSVVAWQSVDQALQMAINNVFSRVHSFHTHSTTAPNQRSLTLLCRFLVHKCRLGSPVLDLV